MGLYERIGTMSQHNKPERPAMLTTQSSKSERSLFLLTSPINKLKSTGGSSFSLFGRRRTSLGSNSTTTLPEDKKPSNIDVMFPTFQKDESEEEEFEFSKEGGSISKLPRPSALTTSHSQRGSELTKANLASGAPAAISSTVVTPDSVKVPLNPHAPDVPKEKEDVLIVQSCQSRVKVPAIVEKINDEPKEFDWSSVPIHRAVEVGEEIAYNIDIPPPPPSDSDDIEPPSPSSLPPPPPPE